MRGRSERKAWAWDPALYAPPRYRRACSYETFTPDPVASFNDALPAELVGIIAEAEATVHRLNDRARPALAPLARLLLRTESIASSKVEGLQVDARSLARAEVNAAVGRSAGSVVAEVIANIDAMELAIEQSSAASMLGLDEMVAIHCALMHNAPNASVAGRVRDKQNWIGGNNYNPCGAAFVPCPPEDLDPLLADLSELCNSDHLSPLVQSAIAHAQFETIHPFEDGNGRTGRALVHVMLRRRGLAHSYVPPISVVLAADKDNYISGLTQFREGDVAAWLEKFAVATAQAALLAENYLAKVEDLQQRWRSRLREHANLRADAAAWAVLDQLPGHPVITQPVATAVTGRSKSSTVLALDQLTEAGVLRPLSSSKRNRAWEADGLLDLLAGLENGE